MGWIRKHTIVLSTLLALVFAVFTLYHPLFLKNVVEKGSKVCKTIKCPTLLFNGGEIVHSERSLNFFVKKQHLDKIGAKVWPVACNLFQKNTKLSIFYLQGLIIPF